MLYFLNVRINILYIYSDLIDFQLQILTHQKKYCAYIYNIFFVCGGMSLVLIGVTFDKHAEIPGVAPTKAQQFIQLREKVG